MLRRNWPILVFVLLQAVPAAAEDFPIVRHANQTEWPFLFLGEVMDESKPRWREYQGAIARFDDLDDCFTEPVRDVIDPAKFKWRDIARDHNFEVCLFRIAVSLETIDEMQRFVHGMGYDDGHVWGSDFIYAGQVDDGPNKILESAWSVAEKGIPFNRNVFLNWLELRLVQAFTIRIEYSNNGSVLDVSTGATSE